MERWATNLVEVNRFKRAGLNTGDYIDYRKST